MQTSRSVFLLSVMLAYAIIGCGPDPTPTQAPTPTPDPPKLGDTRTRPVDGMVMVYVPHGEFQMGSSDAELDFARQQCPKYLADCQGVPLDFEQPSRLVTLDPFWVDQTEVSNAQYGKCVEAGICEEQGCWGDASLNGTEQPVVCVNWLQAQAYCLWVGGRLPTEAEWEYAARGPEGLRYPWGAEFDPSKLNYCDANCEEERADASGDDGYAVTAPVGSYPTGASWCGALDMAGNVWEWVQDWYGYYLPIDEVNPARTTPGETRVARGGGWNSTPISSRAAYRGWGGPELGSAVAGFRCVVPHAP